MVLNNSNNIKYKLSLLPEEPGVYLMLDKDKVVIYVGKALNLKNRIKSYFVGSITDNKTFHLVSHICDFEYIITNSEQEAFLLESNLIKTYQPKYNIIMKDDKKYPYIKINTSTDFPTLEVSREIVKDGSQYYGPYTDARHMRKLIKDVEWILPHKTCKRVIFDDRSLENNNPKKNTTKKSCLNHQIGKCPGPCIGKISKNEYSKLIAKIVKYIKGKDDELLNEFKTEMNICAENLEFEKAAILRDKINYIENLSKKQHVYFNDFQDRDVIAYYKEEKYIAVTLLKMINGKISRKEVFSFKNSTDESPETVLRAFLLQYYADFIESFNETEQYKHQYHDENVTKCGKELPFQILLQSQPNDFESLNILFKKKLIIPSRGEYKQLIEICRKNAFDYIESVKLSKIRKSTRTIIPIQQLKEYLGLKKMPRKIVCIDVSTIQGSETVSSVVCFENGKPLKKQYRHFIIKSIEKQDDFASIAETMDRFLTKILNDENWDIPDLIIIDGGKGQLSSAHKILLKHQTTDDSHSSTILQNKIKIQSIEIVSLAKRIEEVFILGQSESIVIPKSSFALKLITKIRDEAHRFAITHHRKRYSNRVLNSKLDEIKGLGKNMKFMLLKELGSVENIRKADKHSLMKIKGIGEHLAEKILRELTID